MSIARSINWYVYAELSLCLQVIGVLNLRLPDASSPGMLQLFALRTRAPDAFTIAHAVEPPAFDTCRNTVYCFRFRFRFRASSLCEEVVSCSVAVASNALDFDLVPGLRIVSVVFSNECST